MIEATSLSVLGDRKYDRSKYVANTKKVKAVTASKLALEKKFAHGEVASQRDDNNDGIVFKLSCFRSKKNIIGKKVPIRAVGKRILNSFKPKRSIEGMVR